MSFGGAVTFGSSTAAAPHNPNKDAELVTPPNGPGRHQLHVLGPVWRLMAIVFPWCKLRCMPQLTEVALTEF